MPTLTVDKNGAGQRLERFLRKILGGMPKSHVFKLLRTRKVRVNGKRAGAGLVLSAGDTIIIHMPPEAYERDTRRKPTAATSIDFAVKFEDEHLLVVSKPPFLPVHPGAGHRSNSLIDQVHTYLEIDPGPTVFRPSLAHRLDRDTSGLVMIGKTIEVVRRLSKMLRMGQVEKSYLALAKGIPRPKKGTWEFDIERRDVPGSRRAGRSSRAGKKPAGRTDYRVVATRKLRTGRGHDLSVSLLTLRLKTGRTHQIRSHLLQAGHPLAGDIRYGDRALNQALREGYKLYRQFLHAFRLVLDHPISGKRYRWTDPFPNDLQPLVSSLRLGIPAD